MKATCILTGRKFNRWMTEADEQSTRESRCLFKIFKVSNRKAE